MTTENYDVIVIGAGVAGMTAASLLGQDCDKKVLVLERAPFIGGRCLSYVGEGDKVVADGVDCRINHFSRICLSQFSHF